MKKFIFIINPVAGRIRKRHIIPRLKQLAESEPDQYKLRFTQYPEHASQIAADETNNDSGLNIIAVGGDGTVNEVINGVNFDSNPRIGILPYGSGNDVCRFLYKRKKDFLEVITTPELQDTLEFDVGQVEVTQSDGRILVKRFINAVGIGFDAYVAYLNQSAKLLTGIPSYLFAVSRALKNLEQIGMKISIDGKKIFGEFLLITIGNGKTSGGGFYLNPDANPSDEILNITTVDSGSRLDVIQNLPAALFNKLKKVELAEFYEGRNIKLELNTPYYVHLDGEIVSKNAANIETKLIHRARIIKEK